MIALDAQQALDLARRNPEANELIHHLGDRAQREAHEGRIAIERDQLAGRQVAGDHRARADPDDQDDEEPGKQGLAGVQRGLIAGHPHPGEADALALGGIPADELVLAADPAQDPQTRDGVGAECCEPAGLLALGCLSCLERFED